MEDLQSRASDIIKKFFTLGVGAVFLTEESLRSLVSEFKLPKEILAGVIDSANKTKKEFLQGFSQDLLNKIFERVDVKELIAQLVEEHEINLEVKMKLNPRSKGRPPSRHRSEPGS